MKLTRERASGPSTVYVSRPTEDLALYRAEAEAEERKARDGAVKVAEFMVRQQKDAEQRAANSPRLSTEEFQALRADHFSDLWMFFLWQQKAQREHRGMDFTGGAMDELNEMAARLHCAILRAEVRTAPVDTGARVAAAEHALSIARAKADPGLQEILAAAQPVAQLERLQGGIEE